MLPKKYTAPRAATDANATQPEQRKQRAPPSKPPGMSNADWMTEVRRRKAVTTDQTDGTGSTPRGLGTGRVAAAAVAEQADRAAEQAEASRAGMMNPADGHGPRAPWSQQSVGSPAGFSASSWGCALSPGYADDDAHGGFNPNITFPHDHPAQRTPSPAFAGVQYPPYTYSPPAYASSPTPPLRHGRLFSQASSSHLGNPDVMEAGMDEIITTDSVAAAASLGFNAQEETMDLNNNMHDELDYGEEDPEEEEEEEEPTPAPTRRGKKKKRAARTGEQHVKWAAKEDECLAEEWKIVCFDPITGMNQRADTYWERVKSEFDERKLVGPYFAVVHMQRGSKAMANHWGIIQTVCNKWHGIVEEIAARPENGANTEGQMVRMFAMYREDSNTDQDFKYLHVFSQIEKCKKWAVVRRTLAKAKETYKPDAPTPGAVDGRLDDKKRAKSAKDAAPATARLQESIEHCVVDAKTRATQREEKIEARWSALMTNNTDKLDLLRTNVPTKKRNTDLAFLMGWGADMATMDEQVKAWYLAERGLILNQMTLTAAPTPTRTPTPLPSPSNASATPSTEASPTPTSPRTPIPASPTPMDGAAV
nr:uncharacterized protein LOC109778056 [Aegilops tauschii subsp. strangulata]